MKEFGLTKQQLLEEDAETVNMNLSIMGEIATYQNQQMKQSKNHGR